MESCCNWLFYGSKFRPGSFNLYSAGGRLKLFQNLSLSYSGNLIEFNPDTEDKSTFINVFTANYNFTKDLWLKLFAQNNTQRRKYIFLRISWMAV